MNTRKDRQATPFRLTVIRLSLSGILLGFCLCLTACFTHADVPLRARSIRQWEKQQKIREAELNDSLRKDYQVLLDFTGGYRLMGWEPKQFGHYFREGIQQSLTHYDRKAKNDLLTTTFLTDGVLAGHQSVTHPVDPAPTVSRVPDNILEQFTGDWYGLWQTDTVCHRWLPLNKTHLRLENDLYLIAYQSCYVGDGIGWNYLVARDKDTLILGYVYHLEESGEVKAGNPHYAYAHADNHLTWISDDHVYHEFVCHAAGCGKSPHYVITGGRYASNSSPPELVSGFQTMYLPEQHRLPRFRQLFNKKLAQTQRNFLQWLTNVVVENFSRLP